MRVCFIVNEFFGWGKYGGHGSAARLLSIELANQGIDVTVVTPRRAGQRPVEQVDRVKVLSFPPYSIRAQFELYRSCDADIYHTQEPSFGTYLAMKAAPDRIHVVTCRDTKLFRDWLIEIKCYLLEKRLKTLLTVPYENNPLVSRAVRKADAVFCPNEFSIPIAQRKYGLKERPRFLATPVRDPLRPVRKAKTPTVYFCERWDGRKRPEVFFELAEQFPEVSFIAMGRAHSDRRDAQLRQRYGSISNLEMTGFVDQFSSERFPDILSRSWILVNTSLREGLPRTFLEGASYECAILSSVDPDGFATRFGYRVSDGDFAQGLRVLLSNDEWLRRGKLARGYVATTHGRDIAVAAHLQAYQDLLRTHRCRTTLNYSTAPGDHKG